MKNFDVDFSTGIRDSGDDASRGETSNLDEATNVHVREDHQGALHVRPSFDVSINGDLGVSGECTVSGVPGYWVSSSERETALAYDDATRKVILSIDERQKDVHQYDVASVERHAIRRSEIHGASVGQTFEDGPSALWFVYRDSVGGPMRLGYRRDGESAGRVMEYSSGTTSIVGVWAVGTEAAFTSRIDPINGVPMVVRVIGPLSLTTDVAYGTLYDVSVESPGTISWLAVYIDSGVPEVSVLACDGFGNVLSAGSVLVTLSPTDRVFVVSVAPGVAHLWVRQGTSLFQYQAVWGDPFGTLTLQNTWSNARGALVNAGKVHDGRSCAYTHAPLVNAGGFDNRATGLLFDSWTSGHSTIGYVRPFAKMVQGHESATVGVGGVVLPGYRRVVESQLASSPVAIGLWSKSRFSTNINARSNGTWLASAYVDTLSDTPPREVSYTALSTGVRQSKSMTFALISTSNEKLDAIDVVTFASSSPTMGRALRAHGVTIVKGGVPRYVDDMSFGLVRTAPMGIVTAPGGGLAVTTEGSFEWPPGVYTYAFVWMRTDSMGREIRGPYRVQGPITIVSPTKMGYNIDPRSMPMDESFEYTQMEIYVGIGSEPPIRVLTTSRLGAWMAEGHDPLDPDANLALRPLPIPQFATGPIIYSDNGGSELMNNSPPQVTDAVVYSDRLLYTTRMWPRRLYYSKTFREGRNIETSPVLALSLPMAITALAVMDGTVVAFTLDEVYFCSVAFADDQGQGNPYIEPMSVSHGLGVRDSRSVVNTPLGVVFITERRGIYMIARGSMVAQHISSPVSRILGSHVAPYTALLVYGCAYNAETGEVAFVLSRGESAKGFVLIFSTRHRAWFTWEIVQDDYTGSGGIAVRDGRWAISSRPIELSSAPFIWPTVSLGVSTTALERQGKDRGLLNSEAPFTQRVTTRDMFVESWGRSTRFHRIAVMMRQADPDAVTRTLSIQDSDDQGASWSAPETWTIPPTPAPQLVTQPPTYQPPVARASRKRIRVTVSPPIQILLGLTVSVIGGTKLRTSDPRRK